jgi:hypothetical protein
MEDSFAPDPAELAPLSSNSPSSDYQQENSAILPDTDNSNAVANGESDTYEPPDATPTPMDVSSPMDLSSPSDSPPFSPAPPEVTATSAEIELPPSSPKNELITNKTSEEQVAVRTELPLQGVEGTKVYHIAP